MLEAVTASPDSSRARSPCSRTIARACVLVAVTLSATTLAAAPAPARADTPTDSTDCGWYPTAIELARSVADTTDSRVEGIRTRLQQLGITPDAAPPANCSTPNPAPNPGQPVPRQPGPPASGTDPNTPVNIPAGGTEVCDKFGSTPVDGGRYEVQNNVWGSDAPQCVRAFDTGFAVEKAQFTNTDGPASYPSIFTGCHYGTCTTDTSLPRQVSALPAVTSTWAITTGPAGPRWDAAYDIWFDPTPRTTGTVTGTGTEMMIWLDATGPQPIGAKTDTVQLAGTTWDVWRGSNGAQVVSYVRAQPAHSVGDLPLTAFFTDAIARGALRGDWYLTSVQAGFEPWTGGSGLSTTNFAVTGVTTVGTPPPG